jgi:hypothetical protein
MTEEAGEGLVRRRGRIEESVHVVDAGIIEIIGVHAERHEHPRKRFLLSFGALRLRLRADRGLAGKSPFAGSALGLQLLLRKRLDDLGKDQLCELFRTDLGQCWSEAHDKLEKRSPPLETDCLIDHALRWAGIRACRAQNQPAKCGRDLAGGITAKIVPRRRLITVPLQLGKPRIGKVDDPLGDRIGEVGEHVLPDGEQLDS